VRPDHETHPRTPSMSKYCSTVCAWWECHERFYQLWSTSFHGLAMQPYSDILAQDKLTPCAAMLDS
jgi:hypothetical protein